VRKKFCYGIINPSTYRFVLVIFIPPGLENNFFYNLFQKKSAAVKLRSSEDSRTVCASYT